MQQPKTPFIALDSMPHQTDINRETEFLLDLQHHQEHQHPQGNTTNMQEEEDSAITTTTKEEIPGEGATPTAKTTTDTRGVTPTEETINSSP